jgi:tRNA A-37 threonylcarbamoyl transferase component Bud32
MRVDGYTIAKIVHSSAHAQIYEAYGESDRVPVLLKRRLRDANGEREARVLQELHALRRISAAGIPRAIEVVASGNDPILVLERMPGVPLSGLIGGTPLSIRAWLDLAVQLAELLASVHEARVLHQDIRPSHVLLDARTDRVSLVGFGLATDLVAERSGALERDAKLSLHYASPEQTGRMGRGCDTRSDLYSLGATLYHASTGRPPFESLDPLELVHCHIARLPVPACELRPEIPPPLSALILKLLRKQPEERYQSARALLFDLRQCREQWTQTGHLDAAFQLGTSEDPGRPRFSSVLHGREREIEALDAAYARACRGRFGCVLVCGDSGQGKTALVDYLRTQLRKSQGYLAFGNFDPERDRPYAGWVSALESLTQQLLVESDEALARWRSDLVAGLGSIARALAEHVPDLGLILGELAPVPMLGPGETQARLSLAVQRMLQVCATEDHPLILVLDDLQWSDAASRRLLEDLLCTEISAALLLIVTHHGSAYGTDDALAPFVRRLQQETSQLELMQLGPLPVDSVVRMLAEALLRTPEDVLPLARWIEGATGNNPLMIRQFIEDLHDRALLRYEPAVGWTWDAAEIASAAMPENAIALLVAKIDRLEPQARAVLKLASCMGEEFDREQVGELSGIPFDDLQQALYALCDAGLLVPSRRRLRFLHERIREAAQSQLSAVERSRLHFEAGRLLLRLPDPERAERVYEIVEQLDRGLEHVPDDLRWNVIELNIVAGTRALAAGAGATADRYLAVARQLLRDGDRARHRAVVFGLYLDAAESAFQIGQHESALALLDEMVREPLDPLERARVEVKRIRVFALTQHPEDCVRYALGVLRELGVRWSLHPSRLRVWLEVAAIEWLLRGDRSLRLHPCAKVSPKWIAPLILLEPSGGPMARADARLPLLSSCLVLRFSIRYGYIAAPGLTLASYAQFAYPWLNRPKRALELARLSLDWMLRVPDPGRALRTEMQVHTLLHPWLMPRRQALAPVERLSQQAEEFGDREFAYYALLNCYSPLALAGDPVPISEERLRKVAEAARRASLQCPDEGERMHAAYRLLRVELSDGELERHVAESDAWIASHPSSADPYIRTLWLLVLCVHGRYDLAFDQSETLGERLFRIVPFVHVADHTFLRGLAAGALAADVRGATRTAYVRVVRQSLRRMRRWARGGPDFVHMALVLGAERARLRSHFDRARMLYVQGAQQARKQGFLHHAALVQERHASLLLALRRYTESSAALRDAVALYREWGAQPKADALSAQQDP